MTKVLLSLHVLAAIIAIGPVTVAASMFPAALRRGDRDTMRTLHRICRVYALLGVAVPLFGLATASSLGVLGDAWLIVSIVLTAIAAAVLAFAVLPTQATALATAPGDPAPGAPSLGGAPIAPARLGMVAGVFNLLWAIVVVLMIVRPGSTTGA
ncbi:DUF2269 family protein [Actinoplanes sp. CA-142083]|uniref:DUF2269 family protein n=1 Tax=Actinoplanes sp. CA-142083 TaxID=3239903 RepID=UPI003D8D362A